MFDMNQGDDWEETWIAQIRLLQLAGSNSVASPNHFHLSKAVSNLSHEQDSRNPYVQHRSDFPRFNMIV